MTYTSRRCYVDEQHISDGRPPHLIGHGSRVEPEHKNAVKVDVGKATDMLVALATAAQSPIQIAIGSVVDSMWS